MKFSFSFQYNLETNLEYMSVKLQNVKESVVIQMSELSKEFNAIDMTQGYPDTNAPKELTDLVHKYMKADYNQYAPIEGVVELREAISDKINKLYNYKYSAETEITITSGATEAIYSAITAFIDEDDEVIIFEPAYDSYSPVVRLNGGKPIYVNLKHPDYRINWEEVKMHITARTRMIIINSPHNPTGKLLSEDDFEKLNKIVSNSNIVILSDEVSENIVFSENKHISIAQFPELVKRSILISSFGKAFNITGWKIGYTLAPKALSKEIQKIHRFVTFSINKPIQYALAEYLSSNSDYLKLGKFYEEKRNLFVELLKDTKFKALDSEGTFFQLLDYSEISDEKDIDFATRLIKDYGVACIPTSEFYHQKEDNKILRVCFAKSNEILEEVAKRLMIVE